MTVNLQGVSINLDFLPLAEIANVVKKVGNHGQWNVLKLKLQIVSSLKSVIRDKHTFSKM